MEAENTERIFVNVGVLPPELDTCSEPVGYKYYKMILGGKKILHHCTSVWIPKMN